MSMVITPQELEDQKKSRLSSIIIHVLLLLLLILPLISFPDPPPGQSGVLVSFGEPDQGANDERAAPSLPEPAEEVIEEEVEEEKVEEVKPEPKPVPAKPKPQPAKKVNTDINSKEIAIKKQKEIERNEKQKVIDQQLEFEKQEELKEQQRKAEIARKKKAMADAKQRAEAEAKRKRDAEAQALRDAISSGLSGAGSGNNGNPGDQGQPDGDPSGTALDGISTGAGEIGGALGNRGVLYKPKITHNTQKTGDVVVKVCVNSAGKVVSADFTQNGSTTADSGLVSKAIEAAKKYKFDTGSVERQCGTIKIKFRVR